MSIEKIIEKLLDTPPHRIVQRGAREINYSGFTFEVEARELNEDGILIPYVLVKVKRGEKVLFSIETTDLYSWKFLIVYDRRIKDNVEEALKEMNVPYSLLSRGKVLLYELQQETDY